MHQKVFSLKLAVNWFRCWAIPMSLLSFCTVTMPSFSASAGIQSYDERMQALSTGENYLGALKVEYVDCWPASRIPIKVYVHPTKEVPGYKPQYTDFLQDSLKQWSDATDGQLKFTVVDSPVTDGIDITWQPRFDESHQHGGEGGFAKVQPDADGIKTGTVVVFTYPNDDNQQVIDYAVKTSCLHEIGHALGIQGHSSATGDIMSAVQTFSVGATADSIKLHDRDKNTIQAIFKLGPRRNDDVIAAALAGRPVNKEELGVVCIDLINSGVKDLNAGDAKSAIDKFEKCLTIDPANVTALGNLEAAYNTAANQLQEKSQWLSAADMYAKVVTWIDKEPSPDKKYLLAILSSQVYCLHQGSKNEEAAKVEARVNSMSGTSEKESSDAKESTKVAKEESKKSSSEHTDASSGRAGEDIKDRCVALNNTGTQEILHGNYQSAIEKLEKCLQLDAHYEMAESNLEVAYYNWAVKLYSDKDYTRAADVLAKTLKVLDKQAHPEKKHLLEVLQAYADSLRQLGKSDQAQKADDRAQRLSGTP